MDRASLRETLPASPRTRVPASPKPIRSGQKWISESLHPDGRIGTMTTVNHSGVRQRQELRLYRGHECGRVSARKIGTAHRTAEEDIPAEDHAFTEKADAPWRVPRREPHYELVFPHLHTLPSLQLPVRRRRPVELETHPRSVLRERIIERAIEWVQTYRRAGCGVHGWDTHDVIYMSMSKPDLT